MNSESSPTPKTVRDQSIGRMLTVLTNRMKSEMKIRLEPLNLTMNEFFVFMITLNSPGLSQAVLSEKIAQPAYATSRIINSLVGKNLLKRENNPESRRTHRIVLTPEGHALTPDIFDLIQSVNDWLLAPLNADEKQAFSANLAKLI